MSGRVHPRVFALPKFTLRCHISKLSKYPIVEYDLVYLPIFGCIEYDVSKYPEVGIPNPAQAHTWKQGKQESTTVQ